MLQWLCSVYTTKSRFQFYAQMTWRVNGGQQAAQWKSTTANSHWWTRDRAVGQEKRQECKTVRTESRQIPSSRFAAKTDLPQICELNRQACSLIQELMLLIKSKAVSLSPWAAAAVVRTAQTGGLVCHQPRELAPASSGLCLIGGSLLPFRVQPEHAMLRPCPHPFLFHAADCWCSASPGRGPGQRIRSGESCLHARDQSPCLGWPILI